MKRFTKSVTRADRGHECGALHLELRGFSQQTLVTAGEVAEVLNLLPRFHLEGLNEIRFEPDAPDEITHYHNGARLSSRTRAEFIQPRRRIVLYPIETTPLFWQVLLHEIGHHVFFMVLDSRAKQQWVTQIHPRHFCVSEYATRDAQEDFAESYAAYVLAPQILRSIEAKYRFMKDEIFAGEDIRRLTPLAFSGKP